MVYSLLCVNYKYDNFSKIAPFSSLTSNKNHHGSDWFTVKTFLPLNTFMLSITRSKPQMCLTTLITSLQKHLLNVCQKPSNVNTASLEIN